MLDPGSDAILPRGSVGELCFGGAQVFRGYLNSPKLNATKIIEHPQFGRIYRSGDMGILLADDSILFTGRSDDQVKIRGQRVELGEITSIMLDHERVQDCAALLLSHSKGSQSLVSFWVPTEHTKSSTQILEFEQYRPIILELFSSLSSQLPSYMVPSHLVPISAIPLTAQGKIDKRRILKMLDIVPKNTLINYAEPHDADEQLTAWSEREEAIAKIFAQLLELPIEDIRRTSSFLGLGMDSISAISFCNALRSADLGDFSVSTILRSKTVAQLALANTVTLSPNSQHEVLETNIDQVFEQEQISRILSVYKTLNLPVVKIRPCTPLQEAMLSTDQSSLQNAYSNVMVFDIKGDVSRLKECWMLMSQRHDILRTSFASTEVSKYAFAQVVLDSYKVPWYDQEWNENTISRASDELENLRKANKPPVYLAFAEDITSKKLIFCCHHALYDGTAVRNLLNEVQDLYHRQELPPPISYDAYLQHMISQDVSKADQHWRTLFKDFEPTSFPNLSGRTLETNSSPSCTRRRLQMPLSEIRQSCQDTSISLLSIVQTTWAKMLHFYTGEHDVCFGNIVSGRSLPGQDLDRLVAPCFNTVPVRVDFNFSRTNSSLLEHVHVSNIDSLDFHLTPLRRIQVVALEEHGRLFDTLVILQQPTQPLDDSIWAIEHDVGSMDLPIVCEIFQDPTNDALELVLHYQASLLSPADAVVVAKTFDNCMASVIKYPHAAASDFVGCPVDLRAESNMKFQPLESDSLFLHSGFEENAKSRPDRVALDFLHSDGTQTIWTFQTLNKEANRIAHTLVDHGVGPEHVIPIHMLKSPQFYASVLGILKSGAAFAPMHPDLPETLKEFMLKELNAPVILHSEHCQVQAAAPTATVINIDTIKHSNTCNLPVGSLRDTNLAYCLFTSGSTGTPKAVAMEHRSPIQTIESSRSLVPWTSSSRLLQYAAITFDMCYYDCFLSWSLGFTLCAADQSEMLNELPKVINILNVDLLDLTPSIAASLKRSQVPSVKWLYCIGETMSSDVACEWDGLLVNSYGPSEAAFCTTIQPVARDLNTSTIGKPFPSTTFAVFSSNGDRPLPLLSIGELYIGGAQLARGYFGKPLLTDQKFVSKCGQRFHKSGDLVRMLSDGNFEFIGRTDDQVKIRGQRVELGEINHVLRESHSSIAKVVTQILRKETTARDQLVTFVVPNTPLDHDERKEVQDALKKAAVNRLPSYTVPQFFLWIEDIPRSPAGKVDKRVLLNMFREYLENETPTSENPDYASTHEWTELEAEIRQIFARLSKTPTETISPTTSIYQLGLDSISAVQIATALRANSHNIKAADVMKYTTCTDIAIFLCDNVTLTEIQTSKFDFEAFERRHRATVLRNCDVNEADVEAIRPCTPLQNGMISQFLANDGAVYFNSLRLKLHSDIDMEKLRLAWKVVVERNAMLRTGFAHVKDALSSFVMIHYKSNTIDLPWNITLESESSLTIDQWLQNLRTVALDEIHLPPWGLRMVENEANTYLDIGIFHALFDAQSLQSIFNEILAAYNGERLPKSPPLDPVIGGILSTGDMNISKRENFWSQLGRSANTTRFPNMAPLRYDPAPAMVHTRYSERSLSDLENGCRDANITLQAAGIGSWLRLLASYTGEQSVTCGVVLSGRDFEDAEDAIFPCINTVPFSCTVPQDKNELLNKVMTFNAELQEYQHTPLNEAQKLMGFPNEQLFDSIFAYQKLSNQDDTNNLWTIVDENATIEYPVSIELESKGGHLEYRLTFLPHVIPKEQAILLLDQFDHFMENFVFPSTQSSPMATFNPAVYSITPAKEPVLPSEVKLLHELVEVTANQHPQRIAFEFVDAIENGKCNTKKWTYAELDAEGNRIAHLLISHGVSPGQLIGICFNKCPEASFAMLGILKAGCAFVAIDPSAPVARQVFVVEDSKTQIVLSMAKESAQFKDKAKVPVLDLDEVTTQYLPKSKPFLARDVDPQDLSYCLYTSGTTGTPKGCELTHENAVQAMLSFQRLFAGHWDDQSRWLQFASFHFDVSVLEQYWSWSVGICVVSAPRDLIFEDIAQAINALGITHIDLTPSLAQLLHPDEVPSLCRGVFITGGESLKQEILNVWGDKQVIHNGYGPTEATIGVTMYPRVPVRGKPSNIGPQFLNVGSFVLQPGSDIPVLRGGVGELCVSGKLVGKGYLNRPDLTAERFPYLDCFGERVYRTGDLVRILHDGSFDFLGRADDQVKLRGQRLEVSEINSVVKQCDDEISDVATLVLKHPEQQKEQLVSFIVIGRRSKDETKILWTDATRMTSAKDECHAKLPPYMVPTHFIPLTKMPLNVNNKADGRKLRQIYEALSGTDLQKLSNALSEHDQPWSKQESRLRDVLAQVLDVSKDSFSKNTSFFELGMDSISVIGVSKALRREGFTAAIASMLLRCSTISQLAKALTAEGSCTSDHGSILEAQQAITAFQHRHRREVAQSLSIDQSEIEAIAPCTPLQEGIIAKYLESENGLYFNSFHFNLTSEVDEKRLRTAWQEVYASTPILRTAFVDTNDGYLQLVLRQTSLRWPNDTIAMKNETLAKDSLDPTQQKRLKFSRMELRRPFRILSVRTPQQKLVVVHMFHGLYDGYSIGLIFKAVWDAYNGRKSRDNAPSFHSALPYGPLRVIDGAKDFWLKHLTNAPSTPFPTFVDGTSDKPIVVERQLQDLTGFDSVRRKLNVTAQAIGQACWLSVLQLYAKVRFTTGLVVSGRSINLEGAEAIVGPMFNTIPHKHDPQHRETWSSIIKRAHEFNTASHPYQHTPLRDIMKWCKRSPNQPFFDTLFVFKVTTDDEEWVKNEAWEILDRGGITDYALAFEIEQRKNDCFALTLVTQGHISDERTSNELLDQFEEALRQIITDPSEIFDISAVMDGMAENESDKEENIMKEYDGASDYQWTSTASILREEIGSLCGIKTSKITASTSIFELGLDSIDAIKLSSKLKMRGVNLPVSGIMRGLTIAKMDSNILNEDTQANERAADSDLDLQKRKLKECLQKSDFNTDGVEDILPLTPLQEAMVAEMISSDYSRYYNHDVLMLKPETDIAKLRTALTRVVESSPILRTSFVEVDDPDLDYSLAQIVHRQPHGFWSHSEVDGEPNLAKLFEKLRNEAIALGLSQPLFKIRHIEARDQSYLVLTIAHALYDGWSLGLLHSNIQDAYSDQFVPRPDYQSSLAEILSAAGPDAGSFWQDFLAGATLSTLPHRLDSTIEDNAVVHRHEQSSQIALDEITAFTKDKRVSLQSIGQAAFAIVLASYTKSLDVTFGSVLSGRDDDERSQLLFPTMNTVAIRLLLHGTRAEILQYVQETFQSIKEWQHFPLRKALALAGLGGKLFDGLFIYQKSADEQKNEKNSLYTSVQSQSDVEYPVCVEMEVVNNEIVWRCAAKDEVFDEEGVQELLDKLDEVLSRIIEHPELPVIEFTAQGKSVCGLPPFDEEQTAADQVDNTTTEIEEDHGHQTNSKTAQTIRKTLATVSKIPEEEITAQMTIFHIGLDSISAIKVSSQLKKQGIVLSVGEMLRAGTVEKMASIVNARTLPATEKDNSEDDLILQQALSGLDRADVLQSAGVPEAEVAEILPVTAGQLYMLSMWINSKGSNFYPEFTYEIHGNVTFEMVQRSWEAVVDENAILRTIFSTTSDKNIPYTQIVLRQVQSSLTDVTSLSKDEMHSHIQQVACKQPWAHLFVSQISTGWTLKLRIHHALYDGVSLPLLMHQLQDHCNGIAITPTPAKTLTKLLTKTHTSSALEARRSFWTNYLKNSKQHFIPSTPPTTSRVEIFHPNLLQTSTIELLAQNHGISVQALVLAAYTKLYSTIITTITPDEKHDIIIGIYLANRSLSIPSIEDAAIPTVNLVPLRIRFDMGQSLVEAAKRIQQDLRDISEMANAAVSLLEIAQWTGVRIDCFVNFLTLPDTLADGNEKSNGVNTMPKTEQWQQRVARVADVSEAVANVPAELVKEKINCVYMVSLVFLETLDCGENERQRLMVEQNAIDIEASVRGGAMDVGVFAPASLLSLEQGEKLVEGLRGELMRLCEVE